MKLIDWSRVPRGTMTNHGELLCIAGYGNPTVPGKFYAILLDGTEVREKSFDDLRIIPQTRWMYHDGGDCPVPEGLTLDVQYLEGHAMSAANGYRWDKIVAYRITGVDRAGGWTDDASEVTE